MPFDPTAGNTFAPDDTLPTDSALYCADVRDAVVALLPALRPVLCSACDNVFTIGEDRYTLAPVGGASAPGAWRVKVNGAYLADAVTARDIADAVDTFACRGA